MSPVDLKDSPRRTLKKLQVSPSIQQERKKRSYLSCVISVIIPAFNEEERIKKIIQSLRESEPTDKLELIVVDGGSIDKTRSIVESFVDKVLVSTHRCRACQMHMGALEAKGDILLFLHADTYLPVDWGKILRQTWQKENDISATAFRLGFEGKNFLLKIVAHLANWRTERLTKTPHGDQAISVLRDMYVRSGGFPHVPLMEEYYFLNKMKKYGEVKMLPQTVSTSARRYHKKGIIFNSLRNFFLISLFYMGVKPKWLSKLYK